MGLVRKACFKDISISIIYLRCTINCLQNCFLYQFKKLACIYFKKFSYVYCLFRPQDGFDKIVRFCYFWGRDHIQTQCAYGWRDNFDLYGGYNSTNNTIPLYNYHYVASNKDSGNLFLKYFPGNGTFFLTRPPIIYLPGKLQIVRSITFDIYLPLITPK